VYQKFGGWLKRQQKIDKNSKIAIMTIKIGAFRLFAEINF
jgi:hypothetical protein